MFPLGLLFHVVIDRHSGLNVEKKEVQECVGAYIVQSTEQHDLGQQVVTSYFWRLSTGERTQMRLPVQAETQLFAENEAPEEGGSHEDWSKIVSFVQICANSQNFM